jgi:hypothetical protein
MKRTFELLKADTVDSTGTKFTKEALEEAVKEFNRKKKKGLDVWVTKDFSPHTSSIQGRVESMNYSEGAIHVDVEVLPTPPGQKIKSILESTELAAAGRFDPDKDCEVVDGVRVIKQFEITGASLVPMGTKVK